jgi:hypothetical protein
LAVAHFAAAGHRLIHADAPASFAKLARDQGGDVGLADAGASASDEEATQSRMQNAKCSMQNEESALNILH